MNHESYNIVLEHFWNAESWNMSVILVKYESSLSS